MDPTKRRRIAVVLALLDMILSLLILMDYMHAGDDAGFQHFASIAAIAAADEFVLSQRSLLARLPGIPRRKRRLWSVRYDPETKKEVSCGAWKHYILVLAPRLKLMGYIDLSDKYYMLLFRMPQAAFEALYDMVGWRLAKKDTKMRKSVPGKKAMDIFLCWLAHGHKQTQLAIMFCVDQSTVSKLLKRATFVFLHHFVATAFVLPAGQDLLMIEQGFRNLWGLPGCIGAVDGTFMHIQQPHPWGEAYWCYKHYYAVLLLAVVDANMIYRWVHTGSPGSMGDAHVWNHSDYKRMLHLGMMELPCSANGGPAIEFQEQSIKSYVCADTAFALTEKVIKCYDPAITDAQLAFNAAVIRTTS